MSPSIARSLSTILGWTLALVGIAVAFFQTSSLFARFAPPGALGGMWPYLGALMVEGAILWAGLLLMSKSNGMIGGIGVLVFVANIALSGMAQVVEAMLVQGVELPPELGMIVTYGLPASVVVIAALLWLSEVVKSRAMSEGEFWGDSESRQVEAQPQVELLPAARDGSEVEAVDIGAMQGTRVMSASSDTGVPVVASVENPTLGDLAQMSKRDRNKALRAAGFLAPTKRRRKAG